MHGFRGHNGDEESAKRGFNLMERGSPEGHKWIEMILRIGLKGNAGVERERQCCLSSGLPILWEVIFLVSSVVEHGGKVVSVISLQILMASPRNAMML